MQIFLSNQQPFGLLIDEKIAIDNIEKITRIASENDIFVRLDMEDNRVTQSTIDIVTEMHNRGLRNIGTVLQSRLFRTSDDISSLSSKLGGNSDVRICKGIYLESENIAHTNYHDIVVATNNAIDDLLDAGAYTAIASHDIPVINHAIAALETGEWVQTSLTLEKMQDLKESVKVQDMNFKCFLVSEGT